MIKYESMYAVYQFFLNSGFFHHVNILIIHLYFIDFIIHLQMCSYAAPAGFSVESLQDTKSILTIHTGKGVRVVGSLQQW